MYVGTAQIRHCCCAIVINYFNFLNKYFLGVGGIDEFIPWLCFAKKNLQNWGRGT
jgi:hypothetical protein